MKTITVIALLLMGVPSVCSLIMGAHTVVETGSQPDNVDYAACERVMSYVDGSTNFVDEADLDKVPAWMRNQAIDR